MEDDYKPLPPNYGLYIIVALVILGVLWMAANNNVIFVLTPQELQDHLRNSIQIK